VAHHRARDQDLTWQAKRIQHRLEVVDLVKD
jgi:hypothetical protein